MQALNLTSCLIVTCILCCILRRSQKAENLGGGVMKGAITLLADFLNQDLDREIRVDNVSKKIICTFSLAESTKNAVK